MADAAFTAEGSAGPDRAKAFLLTVAIDYPNGEPHIGHAYEKVAGDAIVRYQRLRGRETYFLAGNDEHSQNVLREAQRRGLSPEQFCADMAQVFRHAWDVLGVGYDVFMRTGDPRHVAAVQTLVRRLYEAGHVYRGTYSGWYCVSCEAFKGDRELEGGLCAVHRRPVERLEEANWFFRLSAFRDRVLEHVQSHPEFIRPESRLNEIQSVLREGLEDISISRARRGWGVPLPWDDTQVVYVWFDALITYLSGAGFGWDDDRFSRLWPADLHLIGKDITRFHCVIWPAMLMAAGLPLPRAIYGHGFMNLRGEKLSKTTGNIVDPVIFRNTYGTDATRYYLLAETPFGQDGNFAPESFVKRFNSDLANDLGNLLHRSLTMIERFAQGAIPAPEPNSDAGFAAAAAEMAAALGRAMDDLRPHDALAAVWSLCARANKYIDAEAPWDLVRRGDEARLRAVLYNLAETLRILSVALTPFLVEAPREMSRQLGIDPDRAALRWSDLAWGGLPPGGVVHRGAPLFQRLEVESVLSDPVSFGTAPSPAAPAGERAMAAPALPAAAPKKAAEPAVPVAPAEPRPDDGLITIDDFGRVRLCVATVVSAERVAGADRLLKLELDLGGAGRRQIVSGIAAHYAPEDLAGRQIVVVANLRPATIRGVRSEGMLLAAGDGRTLRLIGPDGPVPAGTGVR